MNERELRMCFLNIYEKDPTNSSNNNIPQIIFYSKQFALFFLLANVSNYKQLHTLAFRMGVAFRTYLSGLARP